MSTPQKSPGDIVREELERGDRLALISDRVQDVLFDTSAWHKITETHVRRLEAHTQDRTFVSTATEINQDQDQRAPGTRSEATREHTDETTTVSSDTAGAAKVTPEAVETPTTTSVVDGDIQQGPPATTSASSQHARQDSAAAALMHFTDVS